MELENRIANTVEPLTISLSGRIQAAVRGDAPAARKADPEMAASTWFYVLVTSALVICLAISLFKYAEHAGYISILRGMINV